MDLQFEKKPLQLMGCVLSESKCCEETKEIRLGESAPDAAGIIAAWGQVLLRSKEWRGGGMTVSGGVLAFILYSVAETGEKHCIEEWIPFKIKWDFPDPGREGKICAWGSLTDMEARLISDRKLMVRANVCVSAQAYAKQLVDLPMPREENSIELLTNTYPLTLIGEVGEHTFGVEEGQTLPSFDRWIRYEVKPEITEQRVMGDKLVFRGNLHLHMLGMQEERIEAWDGELPFSQFAQLDQSYEDNADAFLAVMPTSMEVSRDEEGKWRFLCALTGQYQVCKQQLVTVPEDGYSLQREVTLHREEAIVPTVLQKAVHYAEVESSLSCEAMTVLDVAICPGQGMLDRAEQAYIQNGWCQILYLDPEGNLRGEQERFESSIPMPVAESVAPTLLWEAEKGQAVPDGAAVALSGQLAAREMTVSDWTLPVLSGITYGEEKEKDPDRPSIILRRCGDARLWDIAKRSGTTVSAIVAANGIDTDPAPDKMLIIPIS